MVVSELCTCFVQRAASAASWSLIQKSRSMSILCDIETSTMRRPRPELGGRPWKLYVCMYVYIYIYIYIYVCVCVCVCVCACVCVCVCSHEQRCILGKSATSTDWVSFAIWRQLQSYLWVSYDVSTLHHVTINKWCKMADKDVSFRQRTVTEFLAKEEHSRCWYSPHTSAGVWRCVQGC